MGAATALPGRTNAAVGSRGRPARDHATRRTILSMIAREGPISAEPIAATLGLSTAGIRRHLRSLERDKLIREHRPAVNKAERGRPARFFVATARAHRDLLAEGASLAVEALTYLSDVAGRSAVVEFAAQRAARLERRYATLVEAAGDLTSRAQALAKALNDDGFAASVRPGPGVVQLCQGHCPIQQVAARFPELCEAETGAIGRLLGVHVQRLATLAQGDHVCTTCVPRGVPTEMEAA